MKNSRKTQSYVEKIAVEALAAFQKVSGAAREALTRKPTSPSDVFASGVNSMTSAAVRQFEELTSDRREAAERLLREPAVARILVRDHRGELRTLYVSRATPIGPTNEFVSYKAPLGRLASLPVGGAATIETSGKTFSLIEKALLHPTELREGWDSENTVLSSEEIRVLTVRSLRQFLPSDAIAEEDLVEQILAAERSEVNLTEGIRRRVIVKMALRDQPILDQFQDEIFRLPLNSQLLILGPPGTGKTTTLIRRLGQKLDPEFLQEDERELVEAMGRISRLQHSQGWLMFTPTELLKQYLKEAFAKEGIAASDQRIKTWDDVRRDLARNVFSVLKTATGSASLLMKESCLSLSEHAISSATDWYEDFDRWQRQAFLDQVTQAAEFLKNDSNEQLKNVGSRLATVALRGEGNGIASTLEGLANNADAARRNLEQLRAKTAAILKAELNRQLRSERQFLADLFDFVKDLNESDMEDESEDLDPEDDEDALSAKSDSSIAMNAYFGAVRSAARSTISRKALRKTSRAAKIIGWLGPRLPSEDQLRELGENLILQSNLRTFVNPAKRYLDGIPRRYRAYRRISKASTRWYAQNDFSSSEVHPLEVDILLLAILRSAAELLSRSEVVRDIESSSWVTLRSALDQYRTQILVDEATDFSPIQLACMYCLAHPRGKSFFASGDFNQRLTKWGTKTRDQMSWVCRDLQVREVLVAYRQSRQLNDLSLSIIDLSGGVRPKITLPPDVDCEGVQPAMIENANEQLAVRWLSSRIIEIEKLVGQLPSVAIFVPAESDVQPVAAALNRELQGQNLRVVPCPNGQVVGQQNEIRVFDVQHIKGLEFEAVFFVDLDRLEKDKAELFTGYLYVGATRAATYLGITCRDSFPALLKPIANKFVSGWRS